MIYEYKHIGKYKLKVSTVFIEMAKQLKSHVSTLIICLYSFLFGAVKLRRNSLNYKLTSTLSKETCTMYKFIKFYKSYHDIHLIFQWNPTWTI